VGIFVQCNSVSVNGRLHAPAALYPCKKALSRRLDGLLYLNDCITIDTKMVTLNGLYSQNEHNQ
jgi:hypothetical protein